MHPLLVGCPSQHLNTLNTHLHTHAPCHAAFLGACVLEYLWGGDAPLVHVGLIKQGTSLIQAPM